MDYAVDLHGLTVTEAMEKLKDAKAMEKLKDALNSASAKGKSKLGITTLDSGLIRVIVRGGKNLVSETIETST